MSRAAKKKAGTRAKSPARAKAHITYPQLIAAVLEAPHVIADALKYDHDLIFKAMVYVNELDRRRIAKRLQPQRGRRGAPGHPDYVIAWVLAMHDVYKRVEAAAGRHRDEIICRMVADRLRELRPHSSPPSAMPVLSWRAVQEIVHPTKKARTE